MEASQETCFWAKITQASLKIIKRYVPKKKIFHTVIFEFLKAYIYVENWKISTLIYGGSGAIAPRSQRHFKESDKMEAWYLFFLLFGSAP